MRTWHPTLGVAAVGVSTMNWWLGAKSLLGELAMRIVTVALGVKAVANLSQCWGHRDREDSSNNDECEIHG